MRFLSLWAVMALLRSTGPRLPRSRTKPASHRSTRTLTLKPGLAILNLTMLTQPRGSFADNDEERGIEKVADKVDDTLAIVVHKPPKFPNGLSIEKLTNGVAAKVEAAVQKVPEGLEHRNGEAAEEQRLKDVAVFAKMTKKTKDGMHRDIEPFPAPILTSHTGREDQLYAKDGTRLLSCSVVSRSAKEGGGNVLLISSSNPTKKDWLLPKGGWDEGETIHRAAWREVIEEGGVDAQLKIGLGKLSFKNDKGKKLQIGVWSLQYYGVRI